MIKIAQLLCVAVVVVLFTGCVSTTYTKSITVTKDSSGNVVQTVETESVTQPNQSGWPMKFDHLKGIQPGEK